MADKKGIFIEKLIYDIETSFGSVDDHIENIIGTESISRKEIIEIYEQEKSNKNSKLNKETIQCLHEWAYGTFWDDKWANDFEDFA